MPPAISTKDRIIEAVRLQIETNGLEFSLGDTLRKAGISNGSFNRYYKTKMDVIIEVIRPLIEEQCRFIPPKLDEPDPRADLVAWSEALRLLLASSVGLGGRLISAAPDADSMLYPFVVQLAESLSGFLGSAKSGSNPIAEYVSDEIALLIIIAAALMADTYLDQYDGITLSHRTETSKFYETVFLRGLSA